MEECLEDLYNRIFNLKETTVLSIERIVSIQAEAHKRFPMEVTIRGKLSDMNYRFKTTSLMTLEMLCNCILIHRNWDDVHLSPVLPLHEMTLTHMLKVAGNIPLGVESFVLEWTPTEAMTWSEEFTAMDMLHDLSFSFDKRVYEATRSEVSVCDGRPLRFFYDGKQKTIYPPNNFEVRDFESFLRHDWPEIPIGKSCYFHNGLKLSREQEVSEFESYSQINVVIK